MVDGGGASIWVVCRCWKPFGLQICCNSLRHAERLSDHHRHDDLFRRVITNWHHSIGEGSLQQHPPRAELQTIGNGPLPDAPCNTPARKGYPKKSPRTSTPSRPRTRTRGLRIMACGWQSERSPRKHVAALRGSRWRDRDHGIATRLSRRQLPIEPASLQAAHRPGNVAAGAE